MVGSVKLNLNLMVKGGKNETLEIDWDKNHCRS